jgi:hypothetical protein
MNYFRYFLGLLHLLGALQILVALESDQSTVTIQTFSISGASAIDFDADNNVWIILTYTHEVLKMSNLGANIGKWSATGASDLRIDRTNRKIWVSGSFASVLDQDTGSMLQQFGYSGIGTANVNPRASQGWIPLYGSDQVAIQDSTTYSDITPPVSICHAPYQVAFDNSDNGWVICQGANAVVKVSQGTWIVSAQFGTSALSQPRCIEIDSSGLIWISNGSGSKVIQMDSSDGSVVRQITLAGQATNIKLETNGKLWVGFGANTPLVQLDSTGAQLSSVTVGFSSTSIALDNNGDLWSTNQFSGKAFKILISQTLSPAVNHPSPSPSKIPTRFPTTKHPTPSPSQNPTKDPTTLIPTPSPTPKSCSGLYINDCNAASSRCVWAPIRNGVSACQDRNLIDCSQFSNAVDCKALGLPSQFCVWDRPTKSCIPRFTPNPTSSTNTPTTSPSKRSTMNPTTLIPSMSPTTQAPTRRPTKNPTRKPSRAPSRFPTTLNPTTLSPIDGSSQSPTASPTNPCDKITVQATCEGNSDCKWTTIKNGVMACRDLNWGTSAMVNCVSLKTLVGCQTLVGGVSFCVWDKPNKTCRQRFP